MATFKVGQRVRIMCCGAGAAAVLGIPVPPPGKEGTIIAQADGMQPIVLVDDVPSPSYANGWPVDREHLRPLTDPGADAFMERIKKLKPYDEPVVVKTKERA